MVEEEVKETEEIPEKVEHELPIDSDGNECLCNDVWFTLDMFVNFLDNLRDKFFQFRLDKEEEIIDVNNKENKQKMDELIAELDDKLRRHWPRKGRLEVGIY